MELDNLLHMANRIGQFFAAQPDREEALAGIADHVKKFWAPPMRTRILAALDTDESAGMSEIVRAALTTHRTMLQPATC